MILWGVAAPLLAATLYVLLRGSWAVYRDPWRPPRKPPHPLHWRFF